MNFTLMLSATGLAMYLIVFCWYMRLVIRGGISPNASTWLIWAVLGILNAASYQTLSGDWVKAAAAYGACLTNAATFIIALKLGRFYPLSRRDWLIAIVGLIAATLWALNPKAPYANGLVLSCIAFSAIPTLVGVWIDPSRERPIVWNLLAVSYIFQLIVIGLRWKSGWDLMFPITAMSVNLSVGITSGLRRRFIG